VFAGQCQEKWAPVSSGYHLNQGEIHPMDCSTCGISDEEKQLKRCPICFKHFCDDCATNRGGRLFCSKLCADYFFFGDEE
jgi:hypothetical protein